MFNKKTLKSILAAFTALIMLCASTAFASNTQKNVTAVYNDIRIVVDGYSIVPTDVNGNVVDPFIIDGTTYLPVRALANALGQGVSWDQETSTVNIGGTPDIVSTPPAAVEKKGYYSVSVVAFYNDIKIAVDGNEVTPTDVNGNVVEPFIIDGTTYLPVRALATALGEDVSWDQATSTVYIGEKPFRADAAILKQYADTTFATVGDYALKGYFYNIYVAQNVNSSYFQLYCDNYSADKNLQTLTIDSVPAAKYLTESITESIIPTIVVYDNAKKNGFTEKAEVKETLDKMWESYRKQFSTDAEYNAFLEECGATDAQYKEFITVLSAAQLFTDDLYARYFELPYTVDELTEKFSKDYVTAKHILVEDSQTASEIISKLNKGGSFDKLSEEHNIDPGASPAGYTFTRGEMVPEFEEAAFALKENTYTQSPVKSSYGYHVILRLPIDKKWVESNKSDVQASIASKDTYAVIDEIMSTTKISFTSEFSTYAITIK